jgi:hypothetical protein
MERKQVSISTELTQLVHGTLRGLQECIGLGKTILALLSYEEQLVPNWDFEKPLLLRVADASQNPVGSYLRYCGTYMTPSRQTAAPGLERAAAMRGHLRE